MLSVGSIAVAGWMMWQKSDEPPAVVVEAPQAKQGGTQVDEPWLVERRGDKVIWRLKAKDARQGLSTMEFQQPVLELFTEAGELIVVKGDEGAMELLSRNMHFLGHVEVLYQDWHLVSDDLRFDSRTDEVVVPHAFVITGVDTTIHGRELHANRETSLVEIMHDVSVEDRAPDRLGEEP